MNFVQKCDRIHHDIHVTLYIMTIGGLDIVDEDWIKHWVHVNNLDEKREF
jgi:hypothetical protein